MKLDDETTANMVVNMYAGSLAAQVMMACDRARVRATNRRIEAALRWLVPEGAPDSVGFAELLPLVERQVAAIQSASAGLR